MLSHGKTNDRQKNRKFDDKTYVIELIEICEKLA